MRMQTVSTGAKKWWSDVLGTRVYFRFMEKEDRRRRLAGQFLTFITMILGYVYLLWHFDFINWQFWYYSFTFFLAEFIGLLLFEFFAFNAWFLRFHSPQGIPLEKLFSVDVFITVAGEPIELFKETVAAAVQIDYPNKKVYVLDDKGSVEYQRIADRFGCGYFAREDHSHAKAGNLNYAFQRTSGELVLTLDADQVPQPQIIKTLIGYFNFPRIGFVQSKQDFKVPVGDPFGNMDRIFYNVMQAGKDTDNAAFSCGSGVIYRRKALEDIGGFSTWNLVEDVHTSMLLHDRGWRSIYYNYPLTKGSAPAEIYGVYKQRRQWAADSLRMLFWDNPFRQRGLSFKQKFQYFHLGFVYLVAAFIMPLFFVTPIVALLTNNFVLTASVRSYVLHRFPYFIAMSIAYGILNYPTPYMRAFQMWTGLFPAFIHATWIALVSRKKKPDYQVNVKSVRETTARSPWLAILPQEAIIFLSFFSVIYVFVTGVKAWDFFLLNFVWCLWSAWTMSWICLAAVKKHKWPKGITPERGRVLSFFSRTKELVVTVLLTIFVAVFFTMTEPSEVDRSMNHFRARVLSALDFKEHSPSIPEKVSQTPEVPSAIQMVKKEEPEKASPEILPGTREEEVKKEEVKKEEVKKEEVKKEEVKKEEVGEKKISLKEKGVRRENWILQVASVKTEEQAMVYKERLMAKGFPAYSVRTKVNGDNWIRVRVGFFADKGEAQRAGEEIKRKIIFEGPQWITKASPKEMEEVIGK